jgi:hypothetical protein
LNGATDILERLPAWALYAVLAMVSLAIYGQSVGFPLTWDSATLILENPAIRSFDPVAAFTTPTTIAAGGYSGDPVEKLHYYRPVLQLIMAGWYQVAGEGAAAWHALAVLANIAAVILAFHLVRAMGLPRWAAFAVALLFAANPGRVAGIAWVYGLSDQTFGLFVLAAFLCWVREARWWSLAFLALALGSRETAILFPFVALSWELLFRERGERAWAWLAGLCGLVAAYLVLRILVVGGAPLTAMPPVQLFNSIAMITANHVLSILWPGWGVREYPVEDFSMLSPRLLLSYAVLAAGLAGLAWGVKRNRWVAFWLLWFGIWLSIHFNVGRFGEYLMAEKNNYLLALTFAALFVAAARLAGRHALTVCAVIVVLHGGLSAWRVTHWRDPVTYFTAAIERTPRFATLHYNLANEYVAREDFAKAEHAYLKTIEVDSGHSMAWNNLGNIRFMRQDIPGAADAWQKALESNTANMMAAYNLSLAYKRLGDPEAAARYYSHYLKLKAMAPPQ